MATDRAERRKKRKLSVRKRIFGTGERPRMCVHKSNRNIYVQIVNDIDGKTVCGFSTLLPEIRKGAAVNTRKNVNFAEKIGGGIAELAMEKGVAKVVFDRSGYRYHGVVKALADSARKKGLQF